MRRLAAAAIVAVTVLGTGSAGAHSCSTPAEIPVGEATTITVGVPAELQPVVGVDIDVPDGFRLDKAEGVGPWRLERAGSQLRYRGGVLDPYACAAFNLQGAAERQALLAFPMTVHGQDGSRVEYTSTDSGDIHSAQLVYAGFSPPSSSDGGGSGWLSGSTIGLAAAAAAIGGAFALSRRQQRRARPAPSRPTAKRKSSGTQRRR
ncbi:MAG: hypothetical protein ACRD0C_06590 [Acidimicrobiia bacterium]